VHEPRRPASQESDESFRAATEPHRVAPIRAQVTARLFTGRLDRMLAVGTPAPVGSALHLHAQRLTSIRERETIARTFRRCIYDAHQGNPLFSSRIALERRKIIAAEELIDTVTLWLHSPRPVTARGMARLRLLLADGAGPLYRYGRGDLESRLRAAVAAL
jgi:hypothetical protein